MGYVCFCAKLAGGPSLARDPVLPGNRQTSAIARRLVATAHAAEPARRRGGAALVDAEAPEPFEVRVADEVLDDLRGRLARTRWPSQPAEEGWELGVDVAYLRSSAITGPSATTGGRSSPG